MCTELRIAGSTEAWQQLSHVQVATVAHNISQSVPTSERYYAALKSKKKAAEAFLLRKSLARDEHKEEAEEQGEDERGKDQHES